jgi:hypothetical protein
MKLEELRKVIREEVEKAFKEQLKEVLLEAVSIASTPTSSITTENRQSGYATPKKAEPFKPAAELFKPTPKPFKPTGNPIEDMLQMTKASMTSADAAAIMGEGAHMPSMANTVAHQLNLGGGNQPGLDLSQLPFIGKAKAVLEAANQKDKQRKGLD